MVSTSKRRDYLRQLLPSKASPKTTTELCNELTNKVDTKFSIRTFQRDPLFLENAGYAVRSVLADKRSNTWYVKKRDQTALEQ